MNITEKFILDHPSGGLRKHQRFYIPTGDVELKVDNMLFRVHQHFLIKHSTILRDMLNAPQSGSHTPNGPLITLTGDSIKGWEAIFSLFYAEDIFAPPIFTSDQWAGILRVSHKYMMETLEKRARTSLLTSQPPLDMVEMILLSREVNANDLYEVAFKNLANSDSLSLQDAKKIGVEALYQIMSFKLATPPKCITCERETASWCSDCVGKQCTWQVSVATRCKKCRTNEAIRCSNCISRPVGQCSECSTTINVKSQCDICRTDVFCKRCTTWTPTTIYCTDHRPCGHQEYGEVCWECC